MKGSPKSHAVGLTRQTFGVSLCTCYSWFHGTQSPYGVTGKVRNRGGIFYVLGALLGDGYAYHWRSSYLVGILVKDGMFACRFAEHLSKCIGRNVLPYRAKRRSLWFVRVSNFHLFTLFRNFRTDLELKDVESVGKEEAVEFIKGFFDAEGCVKVIKEEVRKTPKVCLDLTSTRYDVLELIQDLLRDFLQIDAKFSIQVDKRKNRKVVYHLRIYSKHHIRTFFENLQTVKLTKEKKLSLEKWLQHSRYLEPA